MVYNEPMEDVDDLIQALKELSRTTREAVLVEVDGKVYRIQEVHREHEEIYIDCE